MRLGYVSHVVDGKSCEIAIADRRSIVSPSHFNCNCEACRHEIEGNYRDAGSVETGACLVEHWKDKEGDAWLSLFQMHKAVLIHFLLHLDLQLGLKLNSPGCHLPVNQNSKV